MFAYILKRLLLMIPTLFGVMAITFVITQFVPGGPVEQLVSQLTGGDQQQEVGQAATSIYRGADGIDKERLARLDTNTPHFEQDRQL